MQQAIHKPQPVHWHASQSKKVKYKIITKQGHLSLLLLSKQCQRLFYDLTTTCAPLSAKNVVAKPITKEKPEGYVVCANELHELGTHSNDAH